MATDPWLRTTGLARTSHAQVIFRVIYEINLVVIKLGSNHKTKITSSFIFSSDLSVEQSATTSFKLQIKLHQNIVNSQYRSEENFSMVFLSNKNCMA